MLYMLSKTSGGMAQFKVQLQALNPATESLTLFLTPNVELLVGRMSTCNIQLPIPTISNIHLSVSATEAGAISVTDHSSNGVFIDGERLDKRNPRGIVVGQIVTLVRGSRTKAPMEFRVASIDAVAAPPAAPLASGVKRRRGSEAGGGGAALPAPAPPPQRSSVIADRLCTDDYELGRELGSGAFATVFEARHRRTGKSYAVKVMRKDNPALVPLLNGQVVTKLYEEFNIMRALRHPHIPRTYDLYDSAESITIVQELINGGELFDKMIAKTRFDEVKARGLFRQICGAVSYVHSRGVVHRDLKPENILLQAVAEVVAPGTESQKR